MFTDQKKKYCLNAYAIQSNRNIQCNPYENTINFLYRVGTNNPKICMEPEKTLNSQRNVEKENQNGWYHNSRLQALLQSCNHQDSLVLHKDTQISGIEQRTQKWTLNSMVNESLTKQERTSNGKKTISSTNNVGKIGQPHAEE